MDPDLRGRLDKFVIGLLDEAEACGQPPADDIETPTISENSPAPAVKQVSLTERVAILKAATSWWNARGGKPGSDDEAGGQGDKEPEIVRLTDELRRREGRSRRR